MATVGEKWQHTISTHERARPAPSPHSNSSAEEHSTILLHSPSTEGSGVFLKK